MASLTPPIKPFISANGALERIWERFFLEQAKEVNNLVSGFYAVFQDVTISGGIITLTGDYPLRVLTVDTEGGAATDTLDSISGGTNGERIICQIASNSRTVFFKDGAGLVTPGTGFTENFTTDKIEFIRISTGVWHELSRTSSD